MQTFTEFLKEEKQDPEFAALWERDRVLDEIADELIRIRCETGMTQAQMAKLIGTKQSAIARLESGNYNPSLSMLQRVARALGKTLTITMV